MITSQRNDTVASIALSISLIVFVFQNFMFEFQETQDVLFDKVIEISVSISRDNRDIQKGFKKDLKGLTYISYICIHLHIHVLQHFKSLSSCNL